MSQDENWKIVEEEGKLKIKGNYFISDKGNFYSTFSNKYIKAQKDHKGYLYVEIGRKKYKVHRLVAKYFISNPNNLPQINHIDCNKENYEYALKTGTFSREFLYYKGNHKKIWERYREKKLLK